MEKKLFREKSIERISSPEQLNDYLHVTNPGIWILLLAVIILIVGIFAWISQVSIESFIHGTGIVDSNVLTVSFVETDNMPTLETGMLISVGERQIPVTFIGKDENGTLIAGGNTDLPNGTYTASIGYNRTQILKLLFN